MDRFSTSLRRRNYNNRGLVRHHFVDDPCRVMPDGTLWAFVQRTYKEGLLLKSSDRGFTWNRIFNSSAIPSDNLWYHVSPRTTPIPGYSHLDVQGPIVHVEPMPDTNGLYLFTGGDTAAGAYTDYYQYVNTFTETAHPPPGFTLIASGLADEGVFATSAYQQWIAVVFVGPVGMHNHCLQIARFSPYDGSLSGTALAADISNEFTNRFDVVANGKTGRAYIVACDTTHGMTCRNYKFLTMEMGIPYVIDAAETEPSSVAIAQDGYGNLGVIYISEILRTIKFAVGLGGGSSWTTILPAVGGSAPFFDALTVGGGTEPFQAEAHVDIIGGLDGGFLIMYTRRNTITIATSTMPVLEDWSGVRYTNATTAAVTHGGTNYNDALVVAESKHCVFLSGFTIPVPGTMKPTLIYDTKTGAYIYQNTMASIGALPFGNTVPGGAADTAYTLFFAGFDGSSIFVYEAGFSGADDAEVAEPVHLKGFTGAPHVTCDVTGTRNIDMLLIQDTVAAPDRYYTLLLDHSLLTEANSAITFSGWTLVSTILSVYTANGANTDYTLNEAAITGAGATLTGGDGCNGNRGLNTVYKNVGAPSAANNPEPQQVGTPIDLAMNIWGVFNDTNTACDVDLILASKAGKDHSFYCWHGGTAMIVDQLVLAGYAVHNFGALDWIESVFKSNGYHADFTLQQAQLTAAGATLWGDDGTGGERITLGTGATGLTGNGRIYVHEVTTVDGVTYTIGPAKEATSQPDGVNMVGGHFFKPCEDNLLSLAIPGFVRIAYQIDQGNSELQLDSIPVEFAQETLVTAFPISSGFTPTALNQDFYGAGMIGNYTTTYLAAFDTLGTTCRLKAYHPNAEAVMDDRTAYGAATETEVKIVLDPASYGFPIPDLQAVDQSEWVEQDIRRIFLPATFPLLRTFILNAGNFLKRTVWTVLLDGNEYEVSQVVPRFINEQIAFYEANAYVIGPSRDPWSRVILPSET